MKNLLFTLVFSCLFMGGCGSEKGAPVVPATYFEDNSVSGSLIDSTVTQFSYTTGSTNLLLLKNNIRSFSDFIIPSSYAVNALYTCEYNTDVTFSLTAFGNNITQTLPCNTSDTIELGLRKALARTIPNKVFLKTVSVHGALNANLSVNLRQAFNNTQIVAYDTVDGFTCYAGYTFYSDGRLKINKTRAMTMIVTEDADHSSHCPDIAISWSNYQLKNGNIEVDLSMTDDFNTASGHYERWDMQ